MKWEYKILHIDRHLNDVLAQMGAEGWELCAVEPPWGFYFKRPIPPHRDSEGQA